MKIVSVAGANINSLAKFSVDFEAEPLGSAGLVAITGPTGSGKSTLLDAIALGLYGRTPRLDKGTGSLISRGTSKAHVEVTFEVDGNRYRSRWERKLRRDGKPDNASMELTDVGTGQAMVSGVRKVQDKVAQLVGLGHAEFDKAVMLAQGRFDAFLHANGTDRAKILEQLTGIATYRRLSIKAFVRLREAEQENKTLQARFGDVKLLDAAAVAAMTADRATKAAQRDAVRKQLGEAKLLGTWFEQRARLVSDLAAADAAEQRAQAAVTAAAATRAELAASVEAAPLAQPIADAAKASDRFDGTAARVAAAEAALTSMKDEQAKAATWLQANDLEALAAGEDVVQVLLAQWQRARLDSEQAHTSLSTAQSTMDVAAAEVARHSRVHASATEVAAQAQARQSQLQTQWDGLGGQDERALREAFAQLGEASDALERLSVATLREREAAARVVSRTQKLDEARTGLADAEAALPAAAAAVEVADRELDLSARELQLALATVELSARRQELLVEGHACPLCGSTDHPEHPEHAASAPGAGAVAARRTARDEAAAAAKAAHAALGGLTAGRDAQKLAVASHLRDVEDLTGQLEVERGLLEQRLAEAGLAEAPSETELAEQLTQRKSALATRKELLDALDALEDEIKAAQTALTEATRVAGEAATALQAAKTVHTGAERDMAAATAACERAQAAASEAQGAVAEKVSELPAAVAAAAAGDVEGTRRAVAAATSAWSARRAAADELARQAVALQATLETERRQLTEATGERTRTQADLEWAIGFSIFETVAAAEAAQRSAEWTTAARERIRVAEAGLDGARATAVDRAGRLAEHEAARAALGMPEVDEAGCAASVATLAGADEAATAALNAIELELALQGREAARFAELQVEQQALDRTLAIRKELSDLIGSSGGEKFQRFAQGMTLDHLVECANAHLRTLRPRYALARVQDADIDLEVVDRHMADERRPVKTLSGGESFLISLALALGLSDIARQSRSLESLFLDEGFGSLDAKALDDALATLDELRASGRRVFVVSHVAALKEAIQTRIDVRPVGGGRSEVVAERLH